MNLRHIAMLNISMQPSTYKAEPWHFRKYRGPNQYIYTIYIIRSHTRQTAFDLLLDVVAGFDTK
jgi:hypothetical protein